ncbi:carboxyl-terminal-processing protease [Pycnococcus provasolii]
MDTHALACRQHNAAPPRRRYRARTCSSHGRKLCIGVATARWVPHSKRRAKWQNEKKELAQLSSSRRLVMPALRAVTRTDGENSSDEQHALTLWWQTMVDDFSKAAAAAVFALFVAMWPHGGAAAHAAASGTSPPQPTAVTAMGLPGAAWRAIKDADASLARQAARFNGALGGAGTEQPASEDERLAARQLVEEVWSVIDGNFLDARGVGFNREKWATLREDAVDQLGQGGMKRAYGVVRSMIASGVEDPYTRFFEPDDFTRRLASKYDVTGIGLNIGSERDFQERVGGDGPRVEGSLRVVGLVTGSTADVAGIGQGDEIVEVDGSSVLNRSPFEVSSLIQESPAAVPKGSEPPPAAISFIRSSDGKKISVEVPRKRIDDEPVLETSLKRENGVRVGYVRLLEFDSAAERELAAALEKLSAAGADRIVLDLRDNPGGLVLAGVEIAKLFLDQGETVVETVSRAHMNGGEVAASSSSSSSRCRRSSSNRSTLRDAETRRKCVVRIGAKVHRGGTRAVRTRAVAAHSAREWTYGKCGRNPCRCTAGQLSSDGRRRGNLWQGLNSERLRAERWQRFGHHRGEVPPAERSRPRPERHSAQLSQAAERR